MRYLSSLARFAGLVVLLGSGCVPFFDTEPTGHVADITANVCGGIAELRFHDQSASPGQPCGVCISEGHLACNGVDALRCVGARQPNSCGGCLPLEANPFDTCGVCTGAGSGYFVCDGFDALECVNEASYSACGGCTPLAGEPGQPCDPEDSSATWTCADTDTVTCTTDEPNLCGGAEDLMFDGIVSPAPGLPCSGACAPPGVLRCQAQNRIECEESGEANVCGGCGPVPGDLEASCGQCGRYICDDGGMFCVDQEPNTCGGCAALPATPGDSCDGGTIVCNGDDAVICVPQTDETNACGGLGAVSNPPGEPCGICDSGLWICDGTSSVICGGDLGVAARNGCGGCAALPTGPGDPCGECGSGRFDCDPTNNDQILCQGDQGPAARNDCGGCAFLWGTPGDVCGECYVWECSGTNRDLVICGWAGDRLEGCG